MKSESTRKQAGEPGLLPGSSADGGRADARLEMAKDGSDFNGEGTLAIASVGTFLVLVAFTSVLTTIGPTVRALHASAAGRTWIVSGISLGLAAALLSFGALADNLGRRRIFVWATLGLAVSSSLGAVAPTIEILIAARVLQGIAGAGVLAAGLGLIGHAFAAGAARTRATGIWGATVGAGIAVGPAVSAALAAVASWRSVYWVIAAGAALLVPFARRMRESRGLHARHLDLLGALTFAASMACMTAGVTLGRQSWTQLSTVVLLVSAGALLAAFVARERYTPEPLLDLRLFARPLFIASTCGALFTGLGLIALMSFMPLMLQDGLGQTPLASAGILAVWSAPSVLAASQAHRMPSELGSAARLAIGFVLCAGGVAMLSSLDVQTSWVGLAPGMLIAGIGSGLVNAALGRLAVESVPRERAALGSGANSTARYLGGAAGIAAVTAVVAAGTDSPGAAGLIGGWNLAAIVTTLVCVLGALVAACCAAITGHTGSARATEIRQRDLISRRGSQSPPGTATAHDQGGTRWSR